MTLEEFKRPFTDAELRAKFEKEGFEESLWEYCLQINHIAYNELRDSQPDPEEGETIEEYIAYLKEEENWAADTMREEAWNYGMRETYVNAYLSQRRGGHGHDWSFIYAEQVRDESTNPTVDAYYKIKSKNESEANCEREIFVDSLPESKNPIFKKALTQSFGQGQTIEEDIDFARGVAYQYDQLQKIGCKSDEIYNYAQDLAEDHYEIFHHAYMVAIEHKATAKDSYRFADKVEEIQVKGLLPLEFKEFCKEFKEVWQREFYYTLMVEACTEKGEPIGVVCKNQLRQSLGLPPLDETLIYEDEEYLRIKKELTESGVNEVSADRKAYDIAFGTNSETPSIRRNSEESQLNESITRTMFPNEEDYQDYLDGEI